MLRNSLLLGCAWFVVSTSVSYGQGIGGVKSSDIDTRVLVGPGLSLYGTTQLTTNTLLLTVTAPTYIITTANAATEIQFNNSSGVDVSLPAASSDGFTTGFSFGVQNEGTGNVVITPVSGTINGSPFLTVTPFTGCEISSDGANWRVGPSCTSLVPGAAGTGITQLQGDVTSAFGTGPQNTVIVRIIGLTPGTAVGANTGVLGHALGFMDGVNTWSALQTYTANININNGTPALPSLYGSNTGTGINFSNSVVGFDSGGVQKGCITNSGMSAGNCNLWAAANGAIPPFQVNGNTNSINANSMMVGEWIASTSLAPTYFCAKSKSGVIGTHTAVISTDILCNYYSDGSDGNAFFNSTNIQSAVDGAVSTGIVPGKLALQTATSAGVLTNALQVDSKQHTNFNTGINPAVTNGTVDVNASDTSGTVTATSAVTSAVVTFAAPYTTYNHCHVTSQVGLAGFGYSCSLSAITVTASGLGGTKFDYLVDGQ